MIQTFREKINQGKFVLTIEIEPPKGTDLVAVREVLRKFQGKVDAVNVTDSQGGVMKLSSWAMALCAEQEGFESIVQFTTRDRNRIALQSDLLGSFALGIRNVLALTGDHPLLGDHPQAKPVFDLDSVQFLQVIQKLNSGVDCSGNQLKGKTDFFIGAVVNPQADPLEPELIKMEKKIRAGAQFFQTQAVFDLKRFEYFLERTKHLRAKIIAGIVILKSEKMARFLNEHIPGIEVPESVIARMESAHDKVAESLDITYEILQGVRGLCAGVHLMPIGWQQKILPLFERL